MARDFRGIDRKTGKKDKGPGKKRGKKRSKKKGAKKKALPRAPSPIVEAMTGVSY